MQGFAKSILVAILVSVCILMFSNLVFFFPWYMTVVVETFNLSQIAASDNYVKNSYYDDILDRLQDRPIFRQKTDKIEISASNSSGYNAIGSDDETTYYDKTELEKPYRQRGKPINVEIKAVYPLRITIWGEPVEQEIPVTFSLSTIGLKHYKDLDYYD